MKLCPGSNFTLKPRSDSVVNKIDKQGHMGKFYYLWLSICLLIEVLGRLLFGSNSKFKAFRKLEAFRCFNYQNSKPRQIFFQFAHFSEALRSSQGERENGSMKWISASSLACKGLNPFTQIIQLSTIGCQVPTSQIQNMFLIPNNPSTTFNKLIHRVFFCFKNQQNLINHLHNSS